MKQFFKQKERKDTVIGFNEKGHSIKISEKERLLQEKVYGPGPKVLERPVHHVYPYVFDLYGSNSSNPNLVTIGNTGSGKTTFFKKLIQQEQKHATSIVFSKDGVMDYQDMLEEFDRSDVWNVGEYVINPFDGCYDDVVVVESTILSLLKSVAAELSIEWDGKHDILCRLYYQKFLKNMENNEIPTMGLFQSFVYEHFIKVGKEMNDCFNKIESTSSPLNADEFLLKEEESPFVRIQESFVNHQVLLTVLTRFTKVDSDYNKMFNGHTTMPDIINFDLIVVDGLRKFSFIEHSNLLYLTLLTNRIFLERNTNSNYISKIPSRKISIYHDLNHSYFEDSCYSLLVTNIMRRGRTRGVGFRLSLESFNKSLAMEALANMSCVYFMKYCQHGIEELSEFLLTENELNIITHYLNVGEGYIYRKQIVLGADLIPM